MKEGNDTLKTVAAIGGIGVVGFFLYKYYDRKEQEETIKSKVKSLIIDANTSGKNVLSTVQQVAEEIKANPKLQSYDVSEYKNLASKLYNALLNDDARQQIQVFAALKTNVDLKLLNIYFGTRTYKEENKITGFFSIEVLNLSQFMNKVSTNTIRQAIKKILAAKKITYQLF